MVNELMKGIARAIKAEFPGVDVLTEHLEQGLDPPCFFVLCLSQKEQAKLDVRFLAQHTFCISYFPIKGNEECWEVQSKLQRLLEYITVDDDSLVRGTNRKGEIRDEVLHFFVDYDFYMKKQKPKDCYMEVLKVDEKTRRK